MYNHVYINIDLMCGLHECDMRCAGMGCDEMRYSTVFYERVYILYM